MIGEFWDYGKASVRMEAVAVRPVRLILVEDRRGGLESLADHLREQEGMRIDATSDSGLLAGVRSIFDTPDVVLVSGDLVGFTAWDTVRLIKQLCPAVPVIVIGRGTGPCWWLRHTECPDAVVEQPDDHAAIVGLIRSLHARRREMTDPVAAAQSGYRAGGTDSC
jgi:DNA-binding NarL/FixJ family response regulator